MFQVVAVAVVALAGVVAATTPDMSSLKTGTLYAFNRYIALTEARIHQEIAGASPLLWIDRLPASQRRDALAALERGEVVSARLETRDGTKSIDADGALIHHWLGTVFLPDTSVARAKTAIQDYERYSQWFSPLIQRSRVMWRDGGHFRVAMRTEMRKILTVTVDADYVIDYTDLSARAFHARSVATSLHIVDAPGTPGERRTPAEQSFGFLWRLNTYCSFVERGGGTYEQCESVSLTRDVPFGLGLVVRPLVTSIPRETLEFTLGQVRRLMTQRTSHVSEPREWSGAVGARD